MRTPRDWSGEELIKRLGRVGYSVTRQSGSHVRLTDRPSAEIIMSPFHCIHRYGLEYYSQYSTMWHCICG
jgi:predicted RNA binding protein YcfA (HicA-like mRNA interferase family)